VHVRIGPHANFIPSMAEDSGVITICLKVSFEVVRYYKTSLRSNLLRGKAYEYTRDVEHKLILGSDLEVGGGTEDETESAKPSSAEMSSKETSVNTANSDAGTLWQQLSSLGRTFNLPSRDSHTP
jgi:hypothetical protein